MAYLPFPGDHHATSPHINTETATVDWHWIDHTGQRCVATEKVLYVEPHSYTGYFETSFIACTHPEGKSWESLFIPTDKNGTHGISITWWNRKKGLRGQVNVKACSQVEFYDTVASKAVYKGYEVVSFVGRENGLNRRHAFVSDLHARGESVSPALAWGNTGSIPASGIQAGKSIAEAMIDSRTISHFFTKLLMNGHADEVLREGIEVTKHQGMFATDLAGGLFHNINSFLDEYRDDLAVSELDTYQAAKPKVKPAPVAKEELYSGWGVFG